MCSADQRSFFAPDAELAGTRALVIDDDPDVLELLEILLESFGVDVVTATCGNDAFRLFEQLHPDIVTSDVQMPNGDGLDLVRRIRALPPQLGGLTPAIVISGVGRVDESLDAGFHVHFTKPVHARALVDAIRSFLRDEPTGRCKWNIGVSGETITLRWEGHITSADMRAMTTALVPLLEASNGGVRIVSDLRRMTGFTPSVAAVAELALWDVREKMRSVVVVGGSSLARAISRSACLLLGVSCVLQDEPPPVA